MKIAFYGSSLLSCWWNGAATYYRGLLEALARRGYETTFYEPDALDRQQHRDIPPPEWAKSVVWQADAAGLSRVIAEAADADVVIKASGVGVFDDELLEGVLTHARANAVKCFWDVDAAATLSEIGQSPDHAIRTAITELDAVFTYGGGSPVMEAYRACGAAECIPVYNALDPATHFPVPANEPFRADLSLLANRLPDREARIEEFFLKAATLAPEKRFLLGGNGWKDKVFPSNVEAIGHVGTSLHNAFNSSPLAVLNVARDSMAEVGFSPATRVFEATGSGACLITDAWEGIDQFLQPGKEILVARDGRDVAEILDELTPARARKIGWAALQRVLAEHTYDQRAAEVDKAFKRLRANRAKAAA
jgi:spore maturation protein CgeB